MSSRQENKENGKASEETEQRGVKVAALYLLNNKRSGFMWVSRVATMVFTLCYIFPIMGGNPYTYYYKALMANVFTSILRLSERLPHFEFTRAYLGLLLLEDSCHYILYTLIFLYTYPFTLVLLPVFLFAFLHSTNFTLKVLKICGWDMGFLFKSMVMIMSECADNILRLVAYTEIFLMPFNVFMILTGKGSLLTPIIYYRFLTLRYQSRRNPYTRTAFSDMRRLVETLVYQPGIPQRLVWLCDKMIELVSRLAPVTTTAT